MLGKLLDTSGLQIAHLYPTCEYQDSVYMCAWSTACCKLCISLSVICESKVDRCSKQEQWKQSHGTKWHSHGVAWASLPEILSVPDCLLLAFFLHLILCMLLASPTAYPMWVIHNTWNIRIWASKDGKIVTAMPSNLRARPEDVSWGLFWHQAPLSYRSSRCVCCLPSCVLKESKADRLIHVFFPFLIAVLKRNLLALVHRVFYFIWAYLSWREKKKWNPVAFSAFPCLSPFALILDPLGAVLIPLSNDSFLPGYSVSLRNRLTLSELRSRKIKAHAIIYENIEFTVWELYLFSES